MYAMCSCFRLKLKCKYKYIDVFIPLIEMAAASERENLTLLEQVKE